MAVLEVGTLENETKLVFQPSHEFRGEHVSGRAMLFGQKINGQVVLQIGKTPPTRISGIKKD